MLLRVPSIILLGIVIAVVVVILILVFAFGLFQTAQKKMADDVLSEEETDRRSPG